jgi:O-methyltransferase involved in polyketide biosynthesis
VPDRAEIHLEGVPETQLWTLYQRAAEARRRDTVLEDPKAVELVDAIGYPFEERFGTKAFGQWQALRARRFDQEVRRFLAHHPDGTVVSLGEGLETQFWRVDNGRVRWLTVELPESAEVRRTVLPAGSPRQRILGCSALDVRWMDEVDATRGVLITAQGLLMYLRPAEVHGLITACARRFPGAALVFDAIPPWFSAASKAGKLKTDGYVAPPMPWALAPAELRWLDGADGIAEVRRLPPPTGRGLLHRILMPALTRTPVVRDQLLTIMIARFAR